jgi:hypothetical protein
MRVIDWSVAPQNLAVGAASGQFAVAMAAQPLHLDDTVYAYCASVASWIKQGANPTATAGTAGELFAPAGVTVYLSPKGGAKLAVIQAAAGGTAHLALTREV